MQVLLHHIANKYLNRLNATDRERIRVALKNLEKEPPKGDIKQYEGSPGIWRLKASNFRILYKIEGNIIFVTHIEPRSQAYTKKTRTRRG